MVKAVGAENAHFLAVFKITPYTLIHYSLHYSTNKVHLKVNSTNWNWQLQ